MLNLAGLLSSEEQSVVSNMVKLRFNDPTKFSAPESLIIYEQRMMPEDKLLDLCSSVCARKLETPKQEFVSQSFVDKLEGQDCVPISYDASCRTLTIGVLPENDPFIAEFSGIRLKRVYVPIYYFASLFTRYYGTPKFLYKVPAADKFDMIVKEAIALGASDITITLWASGAVVYYNVRKKKIMSRRSLEKSDVAEIATMLAARSGSPLSDNSCMPRSFSVDLGVHYRGRVLVNKTYYGRSLTIRVLSDEILTTSLEDLNLSEETCAFVREVVNSPEKGLRLFIGETHSGKNTSILAALQEVVKARPIKAVSIEQPVEILAEGIEQISVETDEEYKQNAAALLRQNPDIVYIAEISSITAIDTLYASNTGKVVFSTLHANGISDVIPRLADLTGLSYDRILMSLQSCVYQELVRDDELDKLVPINQCFHFTDEVKENLYGKSLGEMKLYFRKEGIC